MTDLEPKPQYALESTPAEVLGEVSQRADELAKRKERFTATQDSNLVIRGINAFRLGLAESAYREAQFNAAGAHAVWEYTGQYAPDELIELRAIRSEVELLLEENQGA